jgi:hypothetical protein
MSIDKKSEFSLQKYILDHLPVNDSIVLGRYEIDGVPVCLFLRMHSHAHHNRLGVVADNLVNCQCIGSSLSADGDMSNDAFYAILKKRIWRDRLVDPNVYVISLAAAKLAEQHKLQSFETCYVCREPVYDPWEMPCKEKHYLHYACYYKCWKAQKCSHHFTCGICKKRSSVFPDVSDDEDD